MRSAADSDEVGCPEPAAVVLRMLSARSWAARGFQTAVSPERSSVRAAVDDGDVMA
jgi:hypothetical protein